MPKSASIASVSELGAKVDNQKEYLPWRYVARGRDFSNVPLDRVTLLFEEHEMGAAHAAIRRHSRRTQPKPQIGGAFVSVRRFRKSADERDIELVSRGFSAYP